jgi:hypothetical protein
MPTSLVASLASVWTRLLLKLKLSEWYSLNGLKAEAN